MIVNFLVGFIFPWMFGSRFLKVDKRIFLFVVFISNVICIWADYKKYWVLKPRLKKRQYLTTLPFNFGLYPVSASLMILCIEKIKMPYFVIYSFAFLTTVAEFCYRLMGKVKYYNGWNILKTFFSYLIPYYLIYKYYLILKLR